MHSVKYTLWVLFVRGKGQLLYHDELSWGARSAKIAN